MYRTHHRLITLRLITLLSAFFICAGIGRAQTTVTLTGPSDGATYTAPASVTLSATVSGGAAVDFVDFFANGRRVGTDSSAPYSATWAGAGGGSYQIKAVVVDSGGNQFASSPINISVSGTGVTLVTPLDGSVFQTGDITLRAATTSAGSVVSKVEFYNGTTLLGTDTSAPYSYTWQSVLVGISYRVTARAYDAQGVVITSFGASFIVTPSASDTALVKDTEYPIPEDGSAYFVATNGNNNWSGKLAEPNAEGTDGPLAGIARAVAVAPVGSTIVLRAGTYPTNSVVLTKKLTLQPYPHEQVWLTGSLVIPASEWVSDGAAWRKDNWTYEFPRISVQGIYGGACPACLDTAYPEADYRDQIFINGEPRKQVLRREDVVAGTFYVDNAADQIFIGDDPAGKTVEATAYRIGLALSRTSPSSADSIVRGLGFKHYAEIALYVESPRVTLENNTSVWNAVSGFNLNGNASGDDAQVIGNTFSYNGRKGIGGGGADRLVLEGNAFDFNNTEFFRTAWDAAGAKFTRADDAIFRRNSFVYNNATGLWLDISITDAIMVHNIARNNRSIGLFFEISSRAIIASNLAIGNGNGIQISGSSAAKIYNNTLVNNSENIQVKDTTRVNTNQAEIAAGVDWETRDNIIKNNIFANARSSDAMLNIFDFPCGSVGPPCNDTEMLIAELDFNAYYRTNTARPPNLLRWKPIGISSDQRFTTLSAFRAATSFEQNGTELSGSLDPFFVNEAVGDYRLRDDSSAKGTGEPLPEDVAAAIGVPAGVMVDRGALNLSAPPGEIDPSAYYEVRAKHSGKCLDVNGYSFDDGAPLIQWSCWGGANQQWQFVATSDGYYRISARHSGKVVDVSGVSGENGAAVIQWTYVGGANQQWHVTPLGDGSYKIVARHSGKALDVNGGDAATSDGTQIIQYDYHGDNNQRWQLVKQ